MPVSGFMVLLLPMIAVATAYAMAIPVVLGTALSDYADCRGSAGALFGLTYYLVIGLGLAFVGWGNRSASRWQSVR